MVVALIVFLKGKMHAHDSGIELLLTVLFVGSLVGGLGGLWCRQRRLANRISDCEKRNKLMESRLIHSHRALEEKLYRKMEWIEFKLATLFFVSKPKA